ncbi:MAG TPA: Rne/Rng family ribonuclease, partial [Rhizomicrobium sp.]|nr:Rne/Rng family ribonuclease [Rhizomicrobium sp.]
EISMKRMLIDASHREETRVVVLDGSKVEEFDFEAASKRPLKGNIYLAKVTRVEPSLQAAFVEYGGNRQGFLAFNEIHPDYYQIPVADRLALLEEQQREARRRAEEEGFEAVETGTSVVSDEELEAEEQAEAIGASSDESAAAHNGEQAEETGQAAPEDAGEHDDEDVFDNKGEIAESEVESGFDVEQAELGDDDHDDDEDGHEHHLHEEQENPLGHLADEEADEGIVDQQTISEAGDAPFVQVHGEEHEHPYPADDAHIVDPGAEADQGIVDEQAAAEPFADGELPHAEGEHPAQPLQSKRPGQRFLRRKHYKIQEVIKRRQVMLVQVVKEERGNKGAALTTYLSLAGRYCVLMPNTPRGGGISRKITNPADRKRLKSAAAALELPEGMGLIIRTAGESRTKLEIKRDYEYLLRLWDQIRELTLESNAPACVYEEGDLIKRVIRDLYTKDVEEIVVEGDEGYKNAKDFMRMLMPSHAKNVRQYKEPVPLFQSMHIEAQLDAMFQPTVTLKSGGYIVINQTEALVAIDVNSGRATREHSIEETAHKTNLEAASEIGRQLRLRDLAGLIVIDFIDMEDSRNDRHVEKRLRDAVKNDRARVQIGKISQFGLMEMSRQRLRAGVVAGSTVTCPHCGGQGIVRSVESTALRVLRGIEEEGQRGRSSAISVKVTPDVAIFMLNKKRQELARAETEYAMSVSFEPDSDIMTGTFEIARLVQRSPEDRPHRPSVSIEAGLATPTDLSEDIEEEEVEEEEEIEEEDEEEREEAPASSEARDPQQRSHDENGEGGHRKRRRRGGRGRNRDRDRGPNTLQEPIPAAPVLPGEFENASGEAEHHAEGLAPSGEQGEGGQRRRRRRRRGRRGRRDGEGFSQQQGYANNLEGVPVDASVRDTDAIVPDETHEPMVAKPNAESAPVWSLGTSKPETEPQTATEAPPKKGWWQRAFSSKG